MSTNASASSADNGIVLTSEQQTNLAASAASQTGHAPNVPLPTGADEERAMELEAKKIQIAAAALQNAAVTLQNDAVAQDLAERKKYASHVFVLICCWVAAIFAVLIFQGFYSGTSFSIGTAKETVTFKSTKFVLSDGVILALIGGTTVSVLGLFVIVANYLFPKKS